MRKRSALEQSRNGKDLLATSRFGRASVKSITPAVTVLDRSGRIIVASEHAGDIFAFHPQLIGQHYVDLFAAEDRHRLRDLIASVLNNSQPMCRIEVGVSRPGKGVTPVVLEIHPVRSARKIAGTIVTVADSGAGGHADELSLRCPACIFLTGAVSDGVIAADDHSMILGVNPVVTRLTGYGPSELVGKPIDFLIPKDAPSAVSGTGPRILNFRKRFASMPSSRLSAKDGREIPVETSSRELCLEGRPLSLVVLRERPLEGRLQSGRRGERGLATLAKNPPDIISRVDRDLRFTYVSPTVRSLFKLPPQHFIGKTTREVGVPSHDWPGFEKACQQVFATGKPEYREFAYGGKNYRAGVIPEFSEEGRVESVICIDQDISRQKRTEMELKTLSARLIDTQDKERQRIARELHDGTAQNLFAMSMVLSRLIKEKPESRWNPLLKECLTLCEESRKEIRTLSYVLHPPILDDAGLVSALKWYVEGFSERSGIKVKLAVEVSAKRFPIEIETAVFRVVQECLANIHRHSGSSTASVKLRANRDRIVLQVRDWGQGMVIGNSRSGVGILGMRERISHLRGHLSIETGARGTTIVATVPLRRNKAGPMMKGKN